MLIHLVSNDKSLYLSPSPAIKEVLEANGYFWPDVLKKETYISAKLYEELDILANHPPGVFA